MTERQRALNLLRRIEREQAYAVPILAHEPGFVRTLVLGVLRWRSRLDFVVGALAKRKIDRDQDDEPWRNVPRYQQFFPRRRI